MDRATIKAAIDQIGEIERKLLAEGKDSLTARLLAQDSVPAPPLIITDQAGRKLREYPIGWHVWAKACEETGGYSDSIVQRFEEEEDDDEAEDD